MKYGIVLDIALCSYFYRVHIAANNGAGPNGNIVTKADIAYYRRLWVDVNSPSKIRAFSFKCSY